VKYYPVRSNLHRCDGIIRAGLLLIVIFAIAGARAALAQSAAGTISSASGQVQIQRGSATLAATPGTPVNQGDKIVSGDSGRAVIILTDQSQLEISPSTTVTIDQYTVGGAAPTRIGLPAGILRSIVRRTGGAPADFQVRTPNAIGAVRGTDFYISYIQGSPSVGLGTSYYTEVDVVDGTVNLAQASAPGNGVDIGPGTSGTVVGNQPPEHHPRKFPTPRPHPSHTPHPHSTPIPG
jgi:FecR-like protein